LYFCRDHGLPLLDLADWNDCLKIDSNSIDGATKEKLYYEQLKRQTANMEIAL